MLRALAIALILAHSNPALAMDDQTAVAESVGAYKKALIVGDGASASALSSRESHELLRSAADRALTMDARDLRSLPSMDQLSVLLLRHSVRVEHLRRMTEMDPVEYVVSAHALIVLGIAETEIDEIHLEDDEAEVYLRHTSSFPPDAAIFLRKEAGAWRIDLVRYLLQFVPVGVIYTPDNADKTTNIGTQIMSSTIAWITGRVPDPDIWNPPG